MMPPDRACARCRILPPMKTELIEKASRVVGDNQLLINIVSKRVQQLTHGSDPYVLTTPEMGLGDIALTEILEGKLVWREAAEESDEAEADPFAAVSEESEMTDGAAAPAVTDGESSAPEL